MKELRLKTIFIKTDRQEAETSYKELIESCLKQVGREGVDAVKMRKRIKILDSLEKAEDVLTLEDEQISELKDLVKHMPWAIVDRGIVEFCDEIEKL